MIYKNGTKLTDRESGASFVVSGRMRRKPNTRCQRPGTVKTSEVAALFEVDGESMPTLLAGHSIRRWIHVGGDHYKNYGRYQPLGFMAG